jgi:plastocyanin
MTRICGLLLVGVLCACSSAERTDAPKPASAENASISEVKGRVPAGALVTMEPASGVAMPEGSAVLDQFSKAFVPETLFVRVGQPVIFKNSEDQLHNVTVVRARTGTGIFNISQNQGDVHTHTFDQRGEYDVTCDVHPGMRATIVATNTPYAVYADGRGVFTVQNIPPGAYTLRVVTQGRESDRVVEITGARVDLGDVRAGSDQ